MKKVVYLITISCCLTFSNAYCQTKYQNIENFKLGTILTFQKCEPDKFDIGTNGKDVIWNFSNLKATNETATEWILAPGSTPESKDYPMTNLIEKYSDGSYVFLKKDENKTYLLGFNGEDSKIKIMYPQPVLIAKRPFSYGEKVSESYTTSYTANDLKFSGKGMVSIEADGFGTLILPNNKYENVIRLKITQTQSDLLEKYNSTNETSIITYVWFDQMHNSALLKITETKSQYYTDKKIEYLLKEQ